MLQIQMLNYGNGANNNGTNNDEITQFINTLEEYLKENKKLKGVKYKGTTYNELQDLTELIDDKMGIIKSDNSHLHENKGKWGRLKELRNQATKEQTEELGNTTEEDYKKYTFEEIVKFIDYTWERNTKFPLSNSVKEEWKKTLENGSEDNVLNMQKKLYINRLDNNNHDSTEDVLEEMTEDKSPTVLLGQANSSSSHSPDEVINEADNFISKANSNKINVSDLKNASNTLYNILLVLGIFLAVGIGMYLGIKFMVSSAEDKAKVKEALVPYIAGCVFIFGAFIVWKLAIILLSGLGN